MPKDRSEHSVRSFLRKHKNLVIVLVIIIGFLAFDLSGFGGNIRFYTKWVECGQKPVGTRGSGLFNTGAIHYVEPPSWALSRPYMGYFCTPLEAEQAGYSANPDTYEFPHIKQAREEGKLSE